MLTGKHPNPLGSFATVRDCRFSPRPRKPGAGTELGSDLHSGIPFLGPNVSQVVGGVGPILLGRFPPKPLSGVVLGVDLGFGGRFAVGHHLFTLSFGPILAGEV